MSPNRPHSAAFDNQSQPPSSSHSLHSNDAARRINYNTINNNNDPVHRTNAMLNANSIPTNPQSSIQLFSKINKMHQQQQQQQPSASSTKMPTIMNENRRKLSLLLSRKS